MNARGRALIAVLLLPACRGAAPPPDPAQDPAAEPVARLLAAPPADWQQHLPAVLALGAAASAPLCSALRRDALAPGAQAAVAALGVVGDAAAVTLLAELVADRGELAVEAALALGRLGHGREVLLPLLADGLADATLRAAAAASLLRLGERERVATLVRGILLAASPAGQELQAQLRLPVRPRWALERYLLIAALQDVAGQDFGLDTDASWPALLAAADRVDAWLRAR